MGLSILLYRNILSLKKINVDSSKLLASKAISGASYYLYMVATFLSLLTLTFFYIFLLQSIFHHFRLLFAWSGFLVYILSSSLYYFCLCFNFWLLSVFVCRLFVLVCYLPVDLSTLLKMIILILLMPLVLLCTPWKNISGFLVLSGGIERDQLYEMG